MTFNPQSANTQDPNLPNYHRPERMVIEEDLELLTDLLGGTRQMWNVSATRHYIRKWTDEQQETYDIRRKGETLFGGFTRTLGASVGMMFAKAPSVTWGSVEVQVAPQAENIDGLGTHVDVFAKRFSHLALRDGLSVLLVDHPPTPAGIRIGPDNEAQLGLRPTWASYPRKNVLAWRVVLVNGTFVTTQLTLYEPGVLEDGKFGVTPVHRFRVLRVVGGQAGWTLYEQIKSPALSPEAFKIVGAGFFMNRYGEVAPRLPIGVAYTGDTIAPFTSTIPLLDVAFANLAHWQLSTDLRFYLSLCAFPQPVVVGDIAQQAGVDASGNQGLIPGKIRLGPGVVIHLKENGSFTWAELEGKSIEKLENAIDAKLHAMAKLGSSFLMKDVRGVETAESKRLDSAAENSTLGTASRGVEDAINEGWRWHAWYLGETDTMKAPTTRLNRDFDNAVLDPQSMLAYVTAVSQAGLPIRILLQAWQDGGRISPDEDLDLLEADMQASIDAKAEADRLAAEQQQQQQADPNADPSKKKKPLVGGA